MGVCAIKNTHKHHTPVLVGLEPAALKKVNLSILVQMTKNTNNDRQYMYVKDVILSKFPNSVFHDQMVSNGNDKFFNLICDGKLLHSCEYDGNIEDRGNEISRELTTIATHKLTSQF